MDAGANEQKDAAKTTIGRPHDGAARASASLPEVGSRKSEVGSPAFTLRDPAEAALEMAAMAGPRAITPDTPQAVIEEIATSPRFRKLCEAAKTANLGILQAIQRRQTEIAQDTARRTYQASDGLSGTLYMRVDAEDFIRMQTIHGADCWDDPAFAEWYRDNNPYCRVKTERGTRGQEYAGRSQRSEVGSRK